MTYEQPKCHKCKSIRYVPSVGRQKWVCLDCGHESPFNGRLGGDKPKI